MEALCWVVWPLIAISCGATDSLLLDNTQMAEDRTCKLDDIHVAGTSVLRWAAVCVFGARSCVDPRDIVCQIKPPGSATYKLRLRQVACPKCLPSYTCVSTEKSRCASLVDDKKLNGTILPKEGNDIKDARPEEMMNGTVAKQLKNAQSLLKGFPTKWTEYKIKKKDKFSSMKSLTGSPSNSRLIFLLMYNRKYFVQQMAIPLKGIPQIQSHKWNIPDQNLGGIKWKSLHTGTCFSNKRNCLLLFGTAQTCRHLVVYSLKEPSKDSALVIVGTARFTSNWAYRYCSSWMFDNNENFGLTLYWINFKPKVYLVTVNESLLTLNITKTPETVTSRLYNIKWHPSGWYGFAVHGSYLVSIQYKDNEQKIVEKVRIKFLRPVIAVTESLVMLCEEIMVKYRCKMKQLTN